MNASTIIDDTMSLDEKLEAIKKAMENAQQQADEEAKANGGTAAPVDPQDMLMCDSCQ